MLRKQIGTVAFITLLMLLLGLGSAFSYNNFQLTDSNQGANSYYIFSFTPSLSYLDVEIAITFPVQYSVSSFAGSLSCYSSLTGKPDDYGSKDCWVEPDSTSNLLYLLGSVVIDLPYVNSTKINYVLLKNVVNPMTNLSSYFQICIRKNGVKLECMKYFSRAVFSPTPALSNLGIQITPYPSPTYIGRGTSYIFDYKISSPSLTYIAQNLIIRVKLPEGFSSDGPICSIGNYDIYGAKEQYYPIKTTVMPDSPNQIDCGPISYLKDMLGPNNQVNIKVDNLINSMSYETYQNTQVQIVRSIYMQPVQIIKFPNSLIEIIPENLQVQIKQSNYMRTSTNVYYFMLNHYTDLGENSSITVQFLSDIWDIHGCFPVNGFSSPSTLQWEILNNKIQLYNYGNASSKVQQIFGVNLTSFNLAGQYPVKLTTQLQDKDIGSWTGSVQLNETIGTYNLLSISAVQAATKLPVDSTGPLEMTFFLNYQLPASDDVPNGTLQITIFPQIPQPDPQINGVIKCYWKGTLQAADCTYDNSQPNKTIITLVSPPHDAFKYSQIPVIITTEGGRSTQDLGLTIDPLVQRYRFQCQFHLYNSSTIPSQVFYTTWIADAIQMTTVKIIATSHQCNEYTHLQINFTTPLLDSSIQKQFRIILQFLNDDGSGWAPSVGYDINKIYQRYPCVVVGLVGLNINCDLYTYYQAVTPYSNMHINNNISGPYILIYGFDQNVPTGIPVRIQIPKIKIGSTVGAKALLGFSILQQTPGQKQPYVQLYFQDIIAFTTLPPISIPFTNVPNSQTPAVLIQTYNQYHIQWSPIRPADIRYVTYQLSPLYLPSLLNKDGVCTSSVCVGLGLPANWIVETVGGFINPHAMDTLLNYVRSMDHLPETQTNLPIRMFTYDGTGKTIDKYQMNIHYSAKVISTASFDFLQTKVYSGLEQWYSISFANTNSTMTDYPFMRFILRDGLSFSDPPQCNSTNILPFNQSELICIRQDPQTMRVHNLKSLNPLGTYNIWFRMQTTLESHTSTISPNVQIQLNHNNSIDSSIVSFKQNLQLSSNPVLPLLKAPQRFQIHNPQIVNEDIQIGYIGPLYMQFVSKVSGVFNIDVQFANHLYNGGFWRTPTSSNLDPVVCFVNQIRYDCSPTNTPLSISVLNSQVVAGLNQIRFDTQYIDPFNGIKFPDVPGMYSIKLKVSNATSASSVTLYAQIQPPKFLHMQAGSIVKDINTQSVYKVNFTLPTWHIYPNSYFDTVNHSRITVQFPTLINDKPAFSLNLGLYQGKFQQRVGCYFKTGANYVSFTLPQTLQCRLIPSKKLGEPVKVQIINNNAFSAAQNSLSVYIFKVVNPQLPHSSVPITVKIDHIQNSTGYVFPLYKQTYRVFLDPRSTNPAPSTYPSIDPSSTQFFDPVKDVGDYGPIFMNAHTVSGTPIVAPFHMLIKLPKYLIPEDSQLAPAFSLCPASVFQQCVSVPQINYLMVKSSFNISQFQANIKNYPISISQDDSFFYSNIIEAGRWTGIVQYNISAAFRWQQIQGVLIYNYCQASGLQSKIVKNKDNFELAISFTTANFIPQQGTIQISFPVSVTNVKPHCRSSAELGSTLLSRSGNSGQIGCMVQNTNKWVITGFADVPAGSTIVIRGQVDLPNVSGSIGVGQIITYADTDLVDIYSNGSRIDYIKTNFNLILVDSFAMNAIQDVFMTQRQVIRAGFVGEFRILLKSDQNIQMTDNIKLKMAMNDIRFTSGGFSKSARPKVCQFIRIDTNQQIGCKVIGDAEDISVATQQHIQYILQPSETLLSSVTYQIRLSSQSYVQPALLQGIPYPTSPGTYKVETITTISGVQKIQHRYIQVYGPAFKQLKVTQYNYLAGQYNLIWVQLMPSVTITTKQQIIIQFPTLSCNGTNMFDNNLGLNGYKDGQEVPVDVFDSPPFDNTYFKCRIYFGDQTRGVPVRVVCGYLLIDVPTTSYLRLAFGFMNPPRITVPSIPSQISLPIIVYSYDPFYFEKTNFNLVNAAVLVQNGQNILAPNGYFATTSNQLQFPNDNLVFADAHTFPLLVGDAYVIRFKFPLRVNDKYPGFCKKSIGITPTTVVYGDAYYHQRLGVIVCKVTTTTVPPIIAPLSAAMMISGFYTPWYRLADSERIVSAIATYASTSTSQVINYFDLFPHLVPRYQFNTLSSLTLQGHIKHYTACQSDDYIFRVRLQSLGVTTTDLQYCKMISINLPLTTVIDYYTLNTDCVQHPDSDIHVIRCNIDLAARAIFIQIVPAFYTNGLLIAVKTKDHAIRNPCVFWNAFDITKFSVLFYSWENITYSDTRSPDYAYMVMDNRNLLPFALTHTLQQYPAANFSYYYTFDWIHTPHERYYRQFPQYTVDQFSPFSFDIWLMAPLAAAQFHKIKLTYGNNYVARTVQSSLDLFYDKTVCYLHNNRVQRCYLDTVNKNIYMLFDFAIPAGKPINVYFSILDSRQPQYNGFRYIGSSDIDKVMVELTQASGAIQVFETEPFMAKETQVGGTGGPLPERGIYYATIDWATNLANQLNVFDMTFYVNRSDIKALQFIIPLRNQINEVVYSSNSQSAFFNINDGGQYPCGNNHPTVSGTGYPKCFIYNGDNTEMGFPTVITMHDFEYSGNIIKARLIFKNPDVVARWTTIKVRAFSGTPDPDSVFGHQYVGYWYFVNFFRTIATVPIVSSYYNWASSYYLRPSKGTWRDFTEWNLWGSTPGGLTMPSVALAVGFGGYAIFQVLLNNYVSGYTDDQFCVPNFPIGQWNSEDMLILKSKQSQYTKAFFIRKWQGTIWTMRYFKCKHYLNSFTSYMYPSQIQMEIDTHTVDGNSFYPLVGSLANINYFQYIENRALFQFDVAPMINTLFAQSFSWEENINYELDVDLAFANTLTWSTVYACYVTGGFENTKGDPPSCYMRGPYAFTVVGFQRIMRRTGGYNSIKIQLYSDDIQSTWNTLGATITLYANIDANLALRQFVYSTTTASPYSRIIRIQNQGSNGAYCVATYFFTPVDYSTYTSPNMHLTLHQFGLNSLSALDVKFTIRPFGGTGTDFYWSGYESYPWFRFYIQGYDFTCFGFNRFFLTYIDAAGVRHEYNVKNWLGSRCGNGFFQVQFRSSWQNLNTGPWSGINFFDSSEQIQVDAQLWITPVLNQAPYLRDWVGIRASINTYFQRYTGDCLYCCAWDIDGNCVDCTYYLCYSYLGGTTDRARNYMRLADSMVLGALSLNVGLPTEMYFSITEIYAAIGKVNVDKLLLLQFNTGVQPFNYINSTAALNHKIQCRCITSWSDNFNPSVTSSPNCVLRLPQLTFDNFAITVDIDVAPNQNLQCYFPGWQPASAFNYTATAKLINQGSSYPPWIQNDNLYGGYYWIPASNGIQFNNYPATQGLAFTENPPAYATPQTVNLFWTSSYQLQLSISPSTVFNPLIYIDFQRSGFIPDQSFCSSASIFKYCRVYNKLRNIIVAEFITPVSTSVVTFTKGSVNLRFPKHKQPNPDYNVVAYLRRNNQNWYSWAGALTRNQADLLLTTVQFYARPQKTTSTNLQTYRTNLILSFNMNGHTFFSTPVQGAKIVITDNGGGLLLTQRGCTASVVDDPTFLLDCKIVAGQVIVTNPSYTSTLSVSGLIQVVVGVLNPSTSVTFTVKSYEYWISASNYGQQLQTDTVYQINPMVGTQQKRSQMRMLPFTTKVYSTVHTPFRIAFKISNSPPSLPDDIHYDLGFRMALSNFQQLAPFVKFECLFKQFTRQPTEKTYTPLPNSYRNWKQYTQYIPLYAYCNKVGNILEIEAPRTKPLSINNYYQLVIMPTGSDTVSLTQTGFPNAFDAEYRLITFPSSCQFIGEYMPYQGFKMKLSSIYLVTSRPLVSTALQLHFQLLFSSPVLFPKHYFEIHFQDISYTAIRPPYNQVGMKVPCTLSSQFVTAGRENGPYCVVNYVHAAHQDLVLRVVQIGSLPASNSYKISLDDFLLPDLSAMLQSSNPFTVCLRFHNQPSNLHYEKCFQEIFVIDGQINTNPVVNNVGTFNLPVQNMYATTVTGNLVFNYPMTSNTEIDQKTMARIHGGYSATSPSPLSFGSHTLLWYNPMINLYILKQPTETVGNSHNIVMNGLINPEPYQKEEYQFINNLQMTYYDDYHPNNYYYYAQPPYSHFVLYPSNVLLQNNYLTDIRVKIPTDGQSIIRLNVSILQSVANLKRKLNDVFQIIFNPADISEVQECWVSTVNAPVFYRSDGWCQTTTDGRVLLYNFYESNVNANLALFIRLRQTSNTIRVQSKLYSDNKEIQYNNTYTYTHSRIDLTKINHALLSFTQNHYTVYYFEQAITPLTISSTCKYLYFSLNLPKFLQYGISIFTVTLPATIIPSNLTEPLQRCQWLLVDRYNRQFHTGVYSACRYLGGNIIITAPYGGLLAFNGATPYSYLLKIRQLDVINTRYVMPTTSKPQQILFSLNDTNIFKYDSLIIHPYEHFTSFAPYLYTLSISQLNTYHIQFIPAVSITPGYQAVLQISIDTRYLVQDLGMPQMFSTYGVDYNNQSRIDNLNYNIKYDILNNKWINGAPYSCYSSTLSLANQTCVHTGKGFNNKRTRITHLLETAYVAGTKYVWKVPLLLNPAIQNTPFRMNLTLWTYQATGTGVGQKQLFYQIINHKFTKPNNPSPIPYTIPTVNPIQSTSANISVRINQLTDVPHNGQFVQLKLNNQLTGIIDIDNLQLNSEPDTSYTFYFFPRVNMLMGHKKVQDFSQKIDLGAIQISNQYAQYYGFDWLKIHSNTKENTTRRSGPVTNLLTHCTINPITSFTVTQGLDNIKDSQFLLTITFINNNCWMPRNSTMIINYNPTVIQNIPNSHCYVSFRQYTCIHAAGRIQLTFYDKIDLASTVYIKVYLRSKGVPVTSTTMNGYIYGIPGTSFTKVIEFPNIGTLSVSTDNMIDAPLFEHILTNYIYEDTQMDIRGTIIPNNPLTYIDMTHPFTSSLANIQRMIIRQNYTSPYQFDYRTELNWFRTIQKVISNVQQIQTIPPNGLLTYDMIPNKQYTFIMESTYDVSGEFNNFTVGKVGQFYQFQYLTENQIAYHEVYPIPVAQHLTIINPFTQISQETAVGFQFSITNYTIVPGNRITIQLDTFNLRYDMFRKTSEFSIQCVQRVKGILTWQPILVCQVTQQPTIQNPNQALIVTVYPKLTVPSGTIIQIWLSPIFNPDIVMVSGAIVKVDRNCNGQKRCVVYEARGYYRTTTGMNIVTGLTGSFAPSQTQVLLKNVQHSFTILPDTYSAMFFRYPENYNTIMPLQCVESGGNTCLIFPSQKRVLTILPDVSIDTMTLTGMNNGIYLQPQSVYFDVLTLSPTQASFYQIPHNNLTTRRLIPTTGVATWMTIQPTQTPGIFLRNYMNTATIKMYGLYSTTFVNAFYINAPKQIVTWDTKYCNATFESLNHDPYPTRLLCSFINDTTMQILIQEGVEQIYLENITQQFIMTVHAKFFIEDFAPGDGILYVTQPVISNTFNSYGSYSTQNHSYAYYITEASTPITISQHRVPIIGKADFNTESYMERVPNINQNTTFELLIDPQTTEQVKRIQFVIPEQFGYPPIGTHDACSLITTDTTHITNCYQIRRDNKTIISLQLQETYDNGPRILKIGSVNQTDWFVAPNMPGSWYNFTVMLYSQNGTLLEAQTTKNCSQIGALDLPLTEIVVTNGRDQNKNQIVDISFVVGNLSIRQGYPGQLSQGQFFTQIRLIFENLQAFARDLGLDRKQGQLTGCATRNILYNQQISCKLNIGQNINDQPYISVTGYQPIMPGANVTISLANILNLPANNNSTVSIAVILKRVNDSKTAFLYNPTKKVLLTTSALSTVLPTQLSITYNSPRVINSPTILNLTITPTVEINSYFVLKFPKDGLNDQYKLFNPSCPLASRIDVFYRSDVVRIYPSTPHPNGTARSYIISGFPTPQYALGPLPWNITVEAYRDLKQANTQLFTIQNFQIASCRFEFGFISSTSPYTYDTQVVYKFQFVISSTSSSNENSLTVGIKFPEIFGDLRMTNMTCEMNSNAKCQFTRADHLQITGTRQSGILIHSLTLRNVNNPSTLNNTFYISSYEGQDIEHPICSGSTQINLLQSPVKNCILEATNEHSTKVLQTIYHFSFTCPDVIRNNSVVLIKIPAAFATNNLNILQCWADNRQNLLSQSCAIKYINGSFYIQANNIMINKNQKIIGINVRMNNPIVAGPYSFNANFTVQNFTYGLTSADTLTIYDQISQPIQSLQLTNLPKQSGVQSYYFLRVPTSSVNSSLDFSLPPQFELPPNVQVQKFTSDSSTWASSLKYDDILGLSGTPLNSQVIKTENFNQKISIENTGKSTNSTGSWTYFLFKKIVNPSYQSQSNFTVQSFYDFGNNQRVLKGKSQAQLNYTLSPPASDIIQTNISVGDNDVLYFTNYTLTYRLRSPHQTNSTVIYIQPPIPEINYALLSLNCCLVVNSSSLNPYTYCNNCTVINNAFKFEVVENNLKIPADTDFQIKLMNLYNPPNATDCSIFSHHQLSYYKITMLKNDFTVTHNGMPPSNMNSPCQVYRVLRADIIPTFPNILYAGMVHPYKIRLSSPTKMLKVILNCSDSLVSFVSNMLYFPTYDVIQLTGNIMVSSVAQDNNNAYINVTHIQSGTFDFFRPNLPIPVKIVANHEEYVIVQQKKANSVGYSINVPFDVTVPSSVDMYLQISYVPQSEYLVFNSTQVLIPAFSSSGYFTFRYDGKTVPQTFNVSLLLKSSYPLYHKLKPKQVYLYFSISQTHNTLPPIMNVQVLHAYKNNSQFLNRKVFHYNNTGFLYYDKILPLITQHIDSFIGSTSADLVVHTREQATVAYLIYQYGDHFNYMPKTPQQIRYHPDSVHFDTKKNSSLIVNPYGYLNLTQLQQQTQYFIYMMAYSTLGNSVNVTVHPLTTKVLSNAASFKLITRKYELKDEVNIVRALADILKIDPYRIKVVSSQKIVAKTYYNEKYQNEPYYQQRIVISPSTTNDDIPPYDIILERLMKSQFAVERLKELIPNWIGRFNTSDLKLQNRVKPVLRSPPIAKKISYYNATFEVRYWEKARIYAILLQYTNQTLETLNYTQQTVKGIIISPKTDPIIQKQIVRGVDSNNFPAHRNFTTLCNKQGYASIFFDELLPGSRYVLYVTSTNPQIYEPTIYSDAITKTQFFTLWNPNLRNKQKIILEQLKVLKPEMYEAIKQFYDNQERKLSRARSIRK